MYYDRITVPVNVHEAGKPSRKENAFVYKMTESVMRDQKKQNIAHSNNSYVRACALTDYLHYELQGLAIPTEITVSVVQLGTKRLLRKITIETSNLRDSLTSHDIDEILLRLRISREENFDGEEYEVQQDHHVAE